MSGGIKAGNPDNGGQGRRAKGGAKRGQRLKAFLKKHRLALVITPICLLSLTVCSVIGYGIYQDKEFAGFFLKGTRLGGVPVGGDDARDATRRLEATLVPFMNRAFRVEGYKRPLALPVAGVGRLDARAMVAEGMDIQKRIELKERAYHRMADNPVSTSIPIRYEVDTDLLRRRLDFLAKQLFVPSRNATISVSPAKVTVIPSVNGRRLDDSRMWGDILAALPTARRVVTISYRPVPAKIQARDLGKVIIIDKSTHMLRLYKGARKEIEYPIACGTAGHPTPTGLWMIVEKRYRPTWINPHTSWSKSMPERIPPGPGNPLGTRALDLNANGIRIHGTPSPWSIGTSASHGCIRMYISDSEDLYPRVEIGTPVYIFD